MYNVFMYIIYIYMHIILRKVYTRVGQQQFQGRPSVVTLVTPCGSRAFAFTRAVPYPTALEPDLTGTPWSGEWIASALEHRSELFPISTFPTLPILSSVLRLRSLNLWGSQCMRTWILIFFHINLILTFENKLCVFKDDHVEPKETGQAAKVEGKASSLFTHQGFVHFNSRAPNLHLHCTELPSLKGQGFLAEDTSNGGQCAMEMQMVHETQQSACASLWSVRLCMASLHRLFLCPRWKAIRTERGQLDLHRLQRRRIRPSLEEVISISKGNTWTEPKEKEEEQKEGRQLCTRSRPAMDRPNRTEHVGLNGPCRSREPNRAEIPQADSSFGETGEFAGSTAAHGRWHHQRDCVQADALCSSQVRSGSWKTTECKQGQAEFAQFLDKILGSIHQKVEGVCRELWQAGPRFGGQSHTSARKTSRSPSTSRRDERKAFQKRRGSSSGRSAHLRCRRRAESGDIRAHFGWHSTDGHEPGGDQSNTLRRAHGGRTSCQKTSQRSRRRCAFWWCFTISSWCQKSFGAFCQGGQIDFTEVCRTPKVCPSDTDYVPIWNHRIISKNYFVPEWKANINALDLAFELGELETSGNELYVFKPPRSTHRKVTFADNVELYVGSELEIGMTIWPHRLGVPHLASKVLQPHEEFDHDQTSLLAMHVPGNVPVADRQEDEFLMDQQNLIEQHDEIDHEQDHDADDVFSDVSESLVSPARSNWQTTLIIPLHAQATTMRLDWNDYELLHASIARELQVHAGDLFHVHHVRCPPQDLYRAHVEIVIPHRMNDIPPGSMERLILLDVEFHTNSPILRPEVVRQAYKLIEPISREQLLRQLGLYMYCSRVQHKCLVWQNNDLVSLGTMIDKINDGDYFRIALPPPGPRMDHIATRCLATAYYQGLMPEEVLDRHTMYMLGWYDYVVDPPLVPIDSSAQAESDDLRMLQLSFEKLPPLPDLPKFLKVGQHRIIGQDDSECPHDRLENELPQFDRAEEEVDPLRGAHDAAQLLVNALLEQPAAIQELHPIWAHQQRQREHEDDTVINIETWFLDAFNQVRCERSREVQLSQDFTQWYADIVEAWVDHIDPMWPINLYLATPQQPATVARPRPIIHMLVVQRAFPGNFANLFTVIDTVNRPERDQVAAFAPQRLHKDDVIIATQYISRCFPAISELQCMIWHGDTLIASTMEVRNRHGLAFILIFNDFTFQMARAENPAWTEDTEGVGLFQKTMTKSRRQVISLDALIPATHAVRLLDAHGTGILPNPLEVKTPADEEQVHLELLQWGHCKDVFQCGPHEAFLCIDQCERQEDKINYLFCHDELGDPNGYFLHSADQVMSEAQIMRFLCQLEYSRAVVLSHDLLKKGWYRVVFHHREPQVATREPRPKSKTAWPSRSTHGRTSNCLFDMHKIPNDRPECKLSTDFDLNDLQEFFESGKNILNTDFTVLELPSPLREELDQLDVQPLECLSDLNQYDRLLIFTDGSSKPSMRRQVPEKADAMGYPDAWSFVVIAEKYAELDQNDYDISTSKLILLGWTAQTVRYDPQGSAYFGISKIGSEQAERAALIGAALWRLSINHAIPTTFCSDSLTGGGQASGQLGTATLDESFRLLRGLFQALEIALPHGALQVHHTRAHVGELMNEVADVAAKSEVQQSFNLPRQRLNMAVWSAKLMQLWTLFGDKCGLPKWTTQGFDVAAPDLPTATVAHGPDAGCSANRQQVFIACSLATANVQSLYRGPCGHAGKLEYLQQQMRAFALNIMAIQEARSEEGMTQARNILRINSGHCSKQYGIEMWIDLDRPYGYDFSGRPFLFKRNCFVVVHRDPTRLLVRCEAEALSIWLFAGHAPHGGHTTNLRDEWWKATNLVLEKFVDTDPLLVMMDANAAPGCSDDQTVYRDGFATSINTAMMRGLLRAWDLYLPITTDVHQGSTTTWTNFAGDQGHCIDHIAIPNAWWTRCTFSQVLDTFDLATTHDDHKVYAIQLQWHDWTPTRDATRDQHPCQHAPCTYVARPDLHAEIQGIHIPPWHTNVEEQAEGLTMQLRAILNKTTQPSASTLKRHKPYMTDQVWELRRSKLQLRHKLKQNRIYLHKIYLFHAMCAWRTVTRRQELPCEDKTDFANSILCAQVRGVAQFRQTTWKLKKMLVNAKQTALDNTMAEIHADTPASVTLRKLRAFTGPSNPKKHKHKPLPLINNQEGQPCVLPTEATATWVSFFQDMECGQRMSLDTLRTMWISELQQFQQSEVNVELHDLPSLTDLEAALRRVPLGRACGPDGLPGELCRQHATLMAKHLFPHLLKILIHGHEHLGFKGGRLTPVYKGRGPIDSCSSYRSLLVSNHLAKALHRTVREKHSQLFHDFLQLQQTGGRKHVPVQLALHQLRACLRKAQYEKFSSGIIFLDLTEAFYRLLREIPLGGDTPDVVIAHIMKKLNMPADSLHEIHRLLTQDCALHEAGFTHRECNAIRAMHTSTHFWLSGQGDVSRTRMGTRPGDSFADWIFSFAWSRVLKEIEQYMTDQGMITHLQEHTALPMFGKETKTDQYFRFIGPTWMDDLALCVCARSPEETVRKTTHLTGVLLDVCGKHCMSPNLQKGKTELLFSLRGAGSRQHKVQLFGPNAPPTVPVVCEKGIQNISLIQHYKHLGALTHHTGGSQKEIAQRAAIAHQAMNQHKKVLYQNKRLPIAKRAELFNMLVLSKFLYGAESWLATDARTEKKFHTVVIALYKRLACLRKHDHHTDDEIIVMTGLPSPEELLRRTRLRYFATLVHTGLRDIWALLAHDHGWRGLLETDMVWMWQQLKGASHLQDPRENYDQWLAIIQNSPGYWKRLVRRACTHCILQRQRELQVCDFYRRVLRRLKPLIMNSYTQDDPEEELEECSEQQAFGCVGCRKRCRNSAGEAAHMFRVHHQVSNLRHLADEPTCGSCLKHFHTMAKLKAHLYYNTRCQEVLRGRNLCCPTVPGTGSQQDSFRASQHDRLLPPLPCHGPQPLPTRRRDQQAIDEGVHQFLFDTLIDGLADRDFEAIIRAHVVDLAISWTCLRRTLLFFLDTIDENDATTFDFNLQYVSDVLRRVSRASNWEFLRVHTQKRAPATLSSLERDCEQLATDIQEHGCNLSPRAFGRHRVVLHAFSGRRRRGDVQFYLDQFAASQEAYVLHVVSMDIIVDAIHGDAMNLETWDFWIQSIRMKHVIAFIGGPPCESWSCAREHQVQDDDGTALGPRVIRVLEHLWGLPSVRLRELFQLYTGNFLLSFALVAFMEVAIINGFAILEHPAEPEHRPCAASIWRLPVVRMMLALPNVQRIRIAQGLLGSATPKPTHLLTANLPNLMLDCHSCRVRTELPCKVAIGTDSRGCWKTTALKEYPPAFCRSIALSISRGLEQTEVSTDVIEPEQSRLHQYEALNVQAYGEAIGADFAG